MLIGAVNDMYLRKIMQFAADTGTSATTIGALITAVGALVAAGVALYRARTESKTADLSTASTTTDTALKSMTELNRQLIAENARLSDGVEELRGEIATVRRDLATSLKDNLRLTLRVGEQDNVMAQLRIELDNLRRDKDKPT